MANQQTQKKNQCNLILMAITIFVFAGCATSSFSAKSKAVNLYENGKKLYDKSSYTEAAANFETVVQNHSDSPMAPVAHYYLACSYRDNGQLDKAKASYQAIIDKYKTGIWVEAANKDLNTLNTKK